MKEIVKIWFCLLSFSFFSRENQKYSFTNSTKTKQEVYMLIENNKPNTLLLVAVGALQHLPWPPAVSPAPLWLCRGGQRPWSKCHPEKWLLYSPPLLLYTWRKTDRGQMERVCQQSPAVICWMERELLDVSTCPASGRPWLCWQAGGRSWRPPPFLCCSIPRLPRTSLLWSKRFPEQQTSPLGFRTNWQRREAINQDSLCPSASQLPVSSAALPAVAAGRGWRAGRPDRRRLPERGSEPARTWVRQQQDKLNPDPHWPTKPSPPGASSLRSGLRRYPGPAGVPSGNLFRHIQQPQIRTAQTKPSF